MVTSPADNWNSIRRTFADQFEQDGANFIYRRSQKGEAIMVSSEERQRFVKEFDRNLRRSTWLIYLAAALVMGILLGVSLLEDFEMPRAAIFVGIALIMIPYLALYRWAWGMPARELTGRTPVAGERSPDEIRRMQYQRVTYGQLAIAAFGGLAIPFIGSAGKDVFSGWNRLWLIGGACLVLFAAVRAFRKWRFEQEDSQRNTIAPATIQQRIETAEDSEPPGKHWFWRYLPLAALLLGLAFIRFTSAGKRLAEQPSFWSLVMLGIGCWALFTVVQGFSKGRIEPFSRGFYNSYERGTQPKRFWASMSWNTLFGCLFLWLAFAASRGEMAPAAQHHCYDEQSTAEAAIGACSEFVRLHPDDADAYLDRGGVFLSKMRLDEAVADFTRAHELDPSSLWPLADRGIAYAWKNDRARADQDFEDVRKIDPANPILLHGQAILSMNSGDLETAIDALTKALQVNPRDGWALQTRADAYQQAGDFAEAQADRARLQQF
jgi:tetratricopeptide (TPR) repeat protein